MNDFNEQPPEDILHLMLEMLKYHNVQLSSTDEELGTRLRSELMSDNYVAILMLENILFGKAERSIN